MRIEYKCVCDRSGQGIIKARDENLVSLNTQRYEFCAPCYNDLSGTIDIWMRMDK